MQPHTPAQHEETKPLWLTEKQVASMIGVSISKLRQDRCRCRSIPYSKFGRLVRYSLADIQAAMGENRIKPVQK